MYCNKKFTIHCSMLYLHIRMCASFLSKLNILFQYDPKACSNPVLKINLNKHSMNFILMSSLFALWLISCNDDILTHKFFCLQKSWDPGKCVSCHPGYSCGFFGIYSSHTRLLQRYLGLPVLPGHSQLSIFTT